MGFEDRVNVTDHRLVREDEGVGTSLSGSKEPSGTSATPRIPSMEVRVRFVDEDGFTGNVERETLTDLFTNETWLTHV